MVYISVPSSGQSAIYIIKEAHRLTLISLVRRIYKTKCKIASQMCIPTIIVGVDDKKRHQQKLQKLPNHKKKLK